MKNLIACLAAVLLISTNAWAAPKSIDDRVAEELAIYTEALALDEDQAAALREGLTEKITIGQNAYSLKQEGKADEAKKMNQAAGKEFNQLLRKTLSKDQFETYKAKRDEIKEAIRSQR